MPRLTKETKQKIKDLDYDVLLDIVFKVAAKEKSVYDFIRINYLEKEEAEEELFDDTIFDLEGIFIKRHRGYGEEVKVKNMLNACTKRINEFTKVCKNKELEAELLIYILDEAFSYGEGIFGTYFTQLDNKVAQILKKLTTILTTKLHEDYLLDYRDRVNPYLKIIKTKSPYCERVSNLPESI